MAKEGADEAVARFCDRGRSIFSHKAPALHWTLDTAQFDGNIFTHNYSWCIVGTGFRAFDSDHFTMHSKK